LIVPSKLPEASIFHRAKRPPPGRCRRAQCRQRDGPVFPYPTSALRDLFRLLLPVFRRAKELRTI